MNEILQFCDESMSQSMMKFSSWVLTPLVIYDEILQFCDENMSKTYHCDVTDNSVMKAITKKFYSSVMKDVVTKWHESMSQSMMKFSSWVLTPLVIHDEILKFCDESMSGHQEMSRISIFL
jgi:hypothetical protein